MTALYRVYGDEGRLLYVGIAADWQERLKQHARTSPWFSCAADLVIQSFATRALAEAAERETIRTEWPLWNLKDSPYKCFAEWLHALHRYERRERELRNPVPSREDNPEAWEQRWKELKAEWEAKDNRLWHLIDSQRLRWLRRPCVCGCGKWWGE